MRDAVVNDFRFLSPTDPQCTKYEAWSRVYEYALVLSVVRGFQGTRKARVHNTAWGFEGCHVTFRDDLDQIADCLHTDIVESSMRRTVIYDITLCEPAYAERFDYVLNISTVEHLPLEKRRQVVENLYSQVLPGGRLIITFDYPDAGDDLLDWLSVLLRQRVQDVSVRLNGANSVRPDLRWAHLNIVYLDLTKRR